MDPAILEKYADEWEDEPLNPLPDAHERALAHLDDKAAKIGQMMRPMWREIVRQAHVGKKPTEIAESVGCAPSTVTNVLKRRECRMYEQVLQARTAYLNAPRIEARIHMLWRIAVNNEQENPRVAISAIDVLNKTTGTYAEYQKDVAAEGATIQVINNFNLPNIQLEDPSQAPIEGEFTPITVDVE